MASTTYVPPQTKRNSDPVGGGDGGFQHGPPSRVSTLPGGVVPSQTGIWVAVSAISMMFAALTSAMIVRQGTAADWVHFKMPPVLYFNTVVLLLSSLTFEISRRRFGKDFDPGRKEPHSDARPPAQALRWLYLTMVLGLIFVLGQLIAWRELAAQGLFLATSPSSSFFYVLTGIHGVHLLGGITGLAYVLRLLSRSTGTQQKALLGVASVYWHFMDGLWVYLILLMMTRMAVV